MADPVSLGVSAAVGIGGSLLSGVIGAKGAEQSAQAQAAAYQYKAGVALLNKQINTTNASWAIQAGGIRSEEAGMTAGQQIGETKVVQAASGIDVTSGTNQRVRDAQETVSRFDENVISWDAAKTAWGFESKAATDEAEANLDIMASHTAKEAGDISALSSYISAGTSVASKWYQASSSGVFSKAGASLSNLNIGNLFMGGGSPTGL